MNNENLNDLKMVVTSGFTVSEQYSSRKVENRTSLEIPISVNPILTKLIDEIMQIKSIQDTTVYALESRMIEEEAFNFSMIPTVFKLNEITTEYLGLVETSSESFSDSDKKYIEHFRVCHKKIKETIKSHELDKLAEKLMENSAE